jgi:hypothetical protein
MEELVTCFKCGNSREVEYECSAYPLKCKRCRSHSMLSYTTALDILNDLFLSKRWRPINAPVDGPEITELDFN